MAVQAEVWPHSGYALAKIQENNQAEIMQTVLEEARESYAAEIVIELASDGPDDAESNVERIAAWIRQWRIDNAGHDPVGRER